MLMKLVFGVFCTVYFAFASVEGDVAFEKMAYRLELVRNQIELTISNHKSLENDLGKQEREFQGMSVYLRVPIAAHDLKKDSELAGSLRGDFQRAAEKHTGFRLVSLKLAGPWRAAPRRIPAEITFDSDYRLPEDQIVDHRNVRFTIAFDSSTPIDATAWLREQQAVIRRLLVPVSCKSHLKRLTCEARIYRYRDFEYPRMLAPDLARYETPAQPSTSSQKASIARIQRYRADITRLWPRVQPCLGTLREFARNDARMNFFLKHVKIDEG